MPRPSRTGSFLRIPYDWRRPTWALVKSRWWNPHDQRILTPKVFGWGFDLNAHALLRRLGRVIGR